MSHQTTDYTQIVRGSVSCIGTDGDSVSEQDCYVIPVVIPAEDVPDLLAQNDPDSDSSPEEDVARPLARLILDALVRVSDD